MNRTTGPTEGAAAWTDETTCGREHSPAETELMRAMDEYRQSSGRMFPTWSEVFEVLQHLGYRRASG